MRLLALEPGDLKYFSRINDIEEAIEFLKGGVNVILYTGGRELYETTDKSDITELKERKHLYDMKVLSNFELYID